jgi:D-glycero-D-manno-heptose 1,7-bisphosphate phosphatase
VSVSGSRKAVFLDRDGVINQNVFYEDTGLIEAPRTVSDFRLADGALDAMARLQAAGWSLFIVSNQPNQALGKAMAEDHREITEALSALLAASDVRIVEAYYCLHHPDGSHPTLSVACSCRKPSPFFLNEAAQRWSVVLGASWMIGDRETDVACGRQAGARTIRIDSGAESTAADYLCDDLVQAADLLIAVSS